MFKFIVINFLSNKQFYVEIVAIIWFYGGNRLALNVFKMNAERVNIYFKIC